jgi:hypothetical protein
MIRRYTTTKNTKGTKIFKLLIFVIFVSFVVSASAQKEPRRVQPDASKKPANNRPDSSLGQLAVTSDPAGAEVYINDRSYGTTSPTGYLNREIKLKPGTYRIRIEYSEHREHSQNIVIRAGKLTQVNATLKPEYGYLELALSNESPDLKIEINGNLLSESDLSREGNKVKIKVRIGEQNVRVMLPGYNIFATRVMVEDKVPVPIPVALERARATLVVEAQQGTRVYIDGESKGIIPSTGRLAINTIAAGQKHKILLDKTGYSKHEETILAESGKEISITARLKPLPSSTEFADNFEGGLSLWNNPQEWKTEGGLLYVRGAGIGMPKEKNYCNGEVIFGLLLSDPRGAAWVVRAQDEKNYYLFYLNGPQGQFPNKLQTYIIRDGIFDLNAPAISPLPIIPSLEVGEAYRIRISFSGKTIEHSITPSKTGEERSLGLFTDPEGVFPCGNIGFTAPTGEVFKIHGFVIKPKE